MTLRLFELYCPLLSAIDVGPALMMVGLAICIAMTIAAVAIIWRYGSLWIRAYASGADVKLLSLIGMSLRQVDAGMIVQAKIMLTQAGLMNGELQEGSTEKLEAQFLAGGNVMGVVVALIAAHNSGISLDFDRAAAIDLAGRDVLDAVRTSISPKVINCPDPNVGLSTTLGAVAKNGVELRIHARVTVRTNLNQLIGGATEETIIARVGQGIVSAIGSADSHMHVLETPDRISKDVLRRGLDENTAFAIVSIDIADIAVGENIGARLLTDQANADMLTAQAHAEIRRMEALALQQEMVAAVVGNRAKVLLAEAQIPRAIAQAIRSRGTRTNVQSTIAGDSSTHPTRIRPSEVVLLRATNLDL